ncbi:hypothetical protein DENSPDRAFT_883600 [Dentipellis sp. KUC8613]|nr:hypothetical protein DENSPDRAFT_883600 [Dentipellis sp. KUC8613]
MSSRLELHLPNEPSPRSVDSAIDIPYSTGKTLRFCDATPLASGSNYHSHSVVYQGTLQICTSGSDFPVDSVNAVCKLVQLDGELEAQMENEANVYNTHLRDLQGDVVPKFYGFYKGSCEWSGWMVDFSCIVLEYCGTPVEEFLDLPIALRSQILDHMYAIHEADILHNDFREPHVLIKSTDDTVAVRIIDFGLSRVSKCRKRMDVKVGDYQPSRGAFGCNELYTVMNSMNLWTPRESHPLSQLQNMSFNIFSYPDVDSLVAYLKRQRPEQEEGSLRAEAAEVLGSWYNDYGHRIEDFGIDDPRKVDIDTFFHRLCIKAWPEYELLM